MQELFRSGRENSRARRLFVNVGIVLLLAILYFLAGKLGLLLAFVNPSTTAIWPPTGITLAAFLLLGETVWPGVLLGAFLVNMTTTGLVVPSLVIAIGNTLEGLIGAYLVRRFANGPAAFRQAGDVLKFTVLAGVVATLVSANIGATSLLWSGLATRSDYLAIWLTWWQGDAGGALIVTPFLILWATMPKIPWTAARVAEIVVLFLSLVLLALAVFTDQSPFGAKNYSLEYAIAPWIIWAAFRFGPRETTTATVLVSAIAIVGTLKGFGPFVQAEPNVSLLLLQGFMGTVTISGLLLAALVTERRTIEGALRDSNNKLRHSIAELEQHNDKMIMLNEMGDLLQSCSEIEEAYTIIGQLGQRLFPEESGALYMINNSQNIVESAVSWGPHPPKVDTFALDECWALRRGRVHILKENGLELLCPHLREHPPRVAACIPMMAQGETMGVLHLQSGLEPTDNPGPDVQEPSETQQQLAMAMADTTALALANLKLRTSLLQQSIRDPLTELFNRRYLEETLEREVRRAARLKRSVAVLMLDIDHFKRFNDDYGHEAGDSMLRELGAFLRSQIRSGDFACRYGGEEFALIFPEVSLKNIQQRAEALRKQAKELHVKQGNDLLENVTISIGIALFPEHGITGKALLQIADAALYDAKRQGRDRVVVAPNASETPEEHEAPK